MIRASRRLIAGGCFAYVKSACQVTVIGFGSYTSMISGYPSIGGTYGCGSSGPHRAENSICCSGVRCPWSRMQITRFSNSASCNHANTPSSTSRARSTPVTIAPSAPAWRSRRSPVAESVLIAGSLPLSERRRQPFHRDLDDRRTVVTDRLRQRVRQLARVAQLHAVRAERLGEPREVGIVQH